MIISNIENAPEQVLMNQKMEVAFHFLQNTNLEDLPDGRIEIDGIQVFAIVESYQTKQFSTSIEFEGHKKYIDVQYVVVGQEVMGWAHLSEVQVTTSYDDKTDAWLGFLPIDKVNLFRISARQIAIFFPTDAHAPQLASGKSAPVKKIVIKIAT